MGPPPSSTLRTSRSIAHPDAQVVHGFQPIMPPFDLSRAQVAELVAYIQALR